MKVSSMNLGEKVDELVRVQYKDSQNLDARLKLHNLYSINKYGWHEFVFDQIEKKPNAKILHLGCGPGYLWERNIDKIPPDWEITLTDMSNGMLEEAKHKLKIHKNFHFEIIDAQDIPYESNSFDIVIGNHLLYHIPDIPRALREIKRVLKRGGFLYASTVGIDHMKECFELVNEVLQDYPDPREVIKPFSLENGANQLEHFFQEVTLHHYDDGLMVTETEPLIDYITSLIGVSEWMTEKIKEKFRNHVQRHIDNLGYFEITKRTGLFIAAHACADTERISESIKKHNR
jgi:ubiquinone/menaquinone biosynthesis C-methylase UbiE